MNSPVLLTAVLLRIGGLNGGLAGMFRLDLVGALIGGMSTLGRIVYVVGGLAAVCHAMGWKAAQRRWVTVTSKSYGKRQGTGIVPPFSPIGIMVNQTSSIIQEHKIMVRLIKATVFVMTIGLFNVLALAGEHQAGTFGLGWYSSSAPVGGRVWLTPKIGVDLGLGYADKKTLGTANDRIHVNIGVPFDAVQTEHVNFFIRPGFELQTNSRTVGTEVKSTSIITADLGVEWFVSEQFTLSAGHGLQVAQVAGSDDWGVSALRALSFNNVGFHFYFSK
jgi:uncharacterized membrane protein YuzA (DUF378 family)